VRGSHALPALSRNVLLLKTGRPGAPRIKTISRRTDTSVRECSIRSARSRGSSTRRLAGTGSGLALICIIITPHRRLHVLYACWRGIDVPKCFGAEANRGARTASCWQGSFSSRRGYSTRSPSYYDLLRAAHDRPEPHPVPDRGACWLHKLVVGAQCLCATVFTAARLRYRLYFVLGQ